ncbi:MAG: 3-hydroxyacyl-CoA dehydrogenase family protein [Lunatimonas sp.]|uniref:3-hydroxyacyl-CoA dehydrogenase family protein n=1 Tax=Lunatimonas sp. TaxID=2060141 RepID=UPI00263AC56F|nr:3-hydroxyacyl-CoA dehydrogenase NAD-binding domain-containing protein [Lunatimonas sp.]MCC5938335.1 3-hydroxyacyl-CoA dehydrogenase family protein [Lunatimonas sp.]
MKLPYASVAVVGTGRLLPEVVCCLLQAGHHVQLSELSSCGVDLSILSDGALSGEALEEIGNRLELVAEITALSPVDLVILITPEDLQTKRESLQAISRIVPEDAVLAVNTESFSLEELWGDCAHTGRIIGLNWVRPAHVTLFAEVIATSDTPTDLLEQMMYLLEKHWNKDPYVVYGGRSIRSRLLAAMIREAFFLVEQGYVGVEDIDRACRNDAGYYMPFAGNLRYMDLMGTNVYGVVMEDLNKELATDQNLPSFFQNIFQENPYPGMESGKGFYGYEQGAGNLEEKNLLVFAQKIRALMDRFPFPRDKQSENEAAVKESMPFTHKNRSL